MTSPYNWMSALPTGQARGACPYYPGYGRFSRGNAAVVALRVEPASKYVIFYLDVNLADRIARKNPITKPVGADFKSARPTSGCFKFGLKVTVF